MTTFAEQYEIFKNNTNDAMRADLAERLGVTTDAIEKLGVGFHFGEQAWIFAERDAKGDIIGLSKRRNENVFKYMAKGSKRGLIYAYNSDYGSGDKKYEAGKFHWVQIHKTGLDCPICGRSDWCRVSSDYGNPKGPSAIACNRIKSEREIPPDAYLHILDAERQKQQGVNNSVLEKSELPIIIVEGASDVLAAMSLGFTCIGRPSAKGGMEILKDMPLAGKEVWIIGENDAGAGRDGVKKTYLNLKKLTETIQCIFPPEGVKDLRQWVQRGLTQELLFEYAGSHGDTSIAIDPNVFPDDTAYIVAKKFMEECYTENDTPLLRNYHDQWIEWTGSRYENIDYTALRGELYRYLDGKQFVKVGVKGIDIVPYKPTKSKINDMLDAMNGWCPVTVDPPSWLDGKKHISPNNLISFKNGMLDVNEYVKGNIVLHDPNPNLFTYTVLPYDFDETAWSNQFEDAYHQWLSENEEDIRLFLQWFGYNIVPDMRQEKLMLIVGPTRSGKGTATEVLQAMLGHNQCCSTSFQSLANPYGLSNLVGKLAAILGDAKTPRKRDSDTALEVILRIVGRDAVTINPKYIKPFDMHLSCRFTIAMNDLPEFSDTAQAFVSRCNILNFPNSYAGREDVTLKTRLRKEASEGKMINFALQGLKDLREQGKFIIPESSIHLIHQLREVVSPMLTFVEECCTIDEEEIVLRGQIFEAWQHWCERSRHRGCNETHFGRKLKQTAPGIKDFRPQKNNRRQWAYKGITLQPWVYEQFIGGRLK